MVVEHQRDNLQANENDNYLTKFHFKVSSVHFLNVPRSIDLFDEKERVQELFVANIKQKGNLKLHTHEA